MKIADPKVLFFNVVPKINVVLILSVFVLGGYLLVLMSRPYQISVPGKSSRNVLWKTDAILNKLPVLDVAALGQHPLFVSAGKKSVGQENKVMLLLGVALGDKKSAMIRDVKANKDYYCAEGDMVGAYQVKEITKDKVVLEYDGSIVEIAR
jgi:type II secretory pathway component PulC